MPPPRNPGHGSTTRCVMMLARVALHVTLTAALTLLSPYARAQSPALQWRVQIDAPDDTLRKLLQTHLQINRYRSHPEVDAALLERLTAGVAADARQLLATEGYFAPRIEVEQTRADAALLVQVRVVPGAQAHVASASIEFSGAIANDPTEALRIANLRQRWRLPPGKAFHQAAWNEAKDALLNDLLLDGYPAARIAVSEARVDPEQASIALQVRADSGPLYRFGEVEITGLQRYPRKLVENLRTFHPGERYNYDALARYQSALQGSGYFRGASVTIDPQPGGPTMVPVMVRITEYAQQKIDLGAGYSTDTGPRVQAAYAHNNAFRPGWQSNSKLAVEGKQQSLSTSLAFLPEPNGWRSRVEAEASRTDVKGLTTQRTAVSASHAHRSLRLERDFTLKYQAETQKIAASRTDDVQALSLNFSWTLRAVDDLLRPRRGYLINLQLGGAAQALLSSRSFVRAYGRGLYILPLGRRDRLHLRAEAGAVQAGGRDGIPSEFLFRAGGDQSLRGYAYQSLGVPEGAAIVGARYLLVGTLEYQHDFTNEWGGALFVDSGNASDSIAGFRAVQGYGLGVRWNSPAGALNFDVARASEDHKLRFHFTIGARF